MGHADACAKDRRGDPVENCPLERVLILRVMIGVSALVLDLHVPLLLLIRLAEVASLGAEFGKGKATLGETLTFLSGPLLA